MGTTSLIVVALLLTFTTAFYLGAGFRREDRADVVPVKKWAGSSNV
ncbi:hypothetical protein MP638_007149 [Amoeboaphelidium occidentale]|nr:hypothetical protein MP638_007149 [Amoeboaphelidium occidentale]